MYTIRYLDGDTERNVPETRIRPTVCRRMSVCDRVEGNYQGRGRWYASRVTAVGGTCAAPIYTLRFDDGDTESSVGASNVRPLWSASNKPYRVDQRVTANWRGRGRYYAGQVTRVVSACCYTVRYSDGDTESCVDPTNIRIVTAISGTCVARTGSGSTTGACTTGYSVEVNWRGIGRYYPGIVTACLRGSYSIRYSDGDTETSVPGSRIRNCRRAATPSPSSCNVAGRRCANGSAVQANFRGRGRYFAATVRSCTGGQFSLQYNDGDSETSVPSSRLRNCVAASTTCSGRSQGYQLGNRVTVNWQNGGRFFPGRITRVNNRNSYNIVYNDNDRENNVPCSRIRPQ